jgi:hypothetical protein
MTRKFIVALALCFFLAGLSTTASAAPKAEEPKVEVVAPGLGNDAIEVVGVEKEGDRMVLRVRNRTPFIVIIYIHGRRIGWLRPFRTGRLRGLRRGFHRLYAHSRWGSFYWGPRSIWVPGTWSLYR